MTNFISPRDLQRSSKKILEEINKSKKPAIILTNKKPVGVIITYDFFEKIKENFHVEALIKKALKESRSGKTKIINSQAKLEKDLKELERYVDDKN